MGLFSTKKVLKVDSREIIIINKSSAAELVVEAEKAIEYFAHHDKFAEFFPKLTFILEGGKASRTRAIITLGTQMILGKSSMVSPREVAKGKRIIHLPLNVLKMGADSVKINTSDAFRDTCRHEAAHLYHFVVNESIVSRPKVLKRLKTALKEKRSYASC